MSVNLEVKGTLAKLLATEDLIVEHKNVSTASFNVKSRVLTLPRWERASGTVFNLLIAHEVGHALFTPNEDWRNKTKAPMGFVNVTEDVRIENLMKSKFGGLPKTFFKGYQELNDKDFFGIEDEDISEMNIADRVNLHFKIGNFVSVPFTEAEQVVVDMCAASRTFEQALEAAEALYELHKKNEEDKMEEEEDMSASPDNNEEPAPAEEGEGQPDMGNQGELDVPQNSEGEGDGEGEDSKSDGTESTKDDVKESESGTGGDSAGDFNTEVKTMDNFSESIETLASKSTYDEPRYLDYPKVDLDSVVASNKDIHEYINASFAKSKRYFEENCPNTYQDIIQRAFGIHEDKYAKFKREIQSEVNYMVKEFECKKSAASYARATTARTGVLDCTKLHTYKYNEDLFRKVTTLPEGKNHGLVFVLDWSGSMCDILEGTMKQLLSLVMFCDKVNIPFDVYAFTNEWNDRQSDPEYTTPELDPDVFHISYEFSMMNILTSRVSRKVLQEQMENMFIIASSYSTRSFDIVPSRMSLSGTPLNEALISLREILPEFSARNGVEKSHVMILTDGEGSPLRYTRVTTDYRGEERVTATRGLNSSCYFRNRKTGSVRRLSDIFGDTTKILLQDLGDQFTGSTFTGFRILESRSNWFIRQATNYDETLNSKWRKERSIALTNFGYDKYYIVASSTLSEDAEFNVDEGASKAKIKSAFMKSLKGKKSNKKILGDFIGLIA